MIAISLIPHNLAYSLHQETLTRHKPMVSAYLESNYDRFFASYTALVLSKNYVTKRQSLKLLGEILLDRANFNVMTRCVSIAREILSNHSPKFYSRYIASEANLKMMMNMLRDKSRNIQFEAFHVFKVNIILSLSDLVDNSSRYSWRTQRSLHRSRQFSAVTRRNYLLS